MTAYKFDPEQDWFSHSIPEWTEFLKALDGQPIRVLEIGSHEGRSAMWIVDNLLSNPKSNLTCVDPWNDDKPWNHKAAESRFDANVAMNPRRAQVFKKKIRSAAFMSGVQAAKNFEIYEFIYVDGCHEAKHVIEDFVLAWPLLKIGGILIFDDYTWTHERHFRCPKPAIDMILELWAQDLEVLRVTHQVILRKTKNSGYCYEDKK